MRRILKVNEIMKKIGFVFMLLIIFGGSAWGGWFTFEPNLVLLEGTAVSRDLEAVEKEYTFIEKGDIEQANQLIKNEEVRIVKNGDDQTHVTYSDYEENNGSIFIRFKNESGSKLWANITGLACEGQDGKLRNVTKQDVIKKDFKILSEINR
jgi:hypothetical protein